MHDEADGGEARVDRIAAQVEALGARVDDLAARVGPAVEQALMTAEQLAEYAARMIPIVEARLEAHGERIENVVAGLTAAGAIAAVPEAGAHLAAIEDQVAQIGRTMLLVERALAERTESPFEFQEMAILTQVEQWFEETNSRLAGDMEHIRRDLHRFDEAVVELQRRAESMPERVVMQQPAARLDQAIMTQLEARLEEVAQRLMQRIDDHVSERVQRFEALSQAMISLVGDPVDVLTEKLHQLAKEREPALRASESIRGIAEAQVLMATTISALRHDSLEREALLRHTLDKLEQLNDSRTKGDT